MPIICIDGNIGSGKSSILQKLHNEHRYLTTLEPIEQWMPFLENIYKNKKGYYEFQVKVWSDRTFIQEKTEDMMLFERSPHFSRNTFIKVLLELNNITKEQYNNLNIMYDTTESRWKPDKYIYIRVSPETSYKRIKERKREFEENITSDYIKLLNNYYEETFIKAKEEGMDIIDINGEEEIDKIIKKILEMI